MRNFWRSLTACLLFAAVCVSTTHLAGEEESRAWKSADGKYQTKAQFVEISGKNAKLKREDGKVISVPIAKLSDADKEYLQTLLAKNKPAASKPPVTPFEVEGVFAIAPPNAEYTWEVAQAGEQQGMAFHILACRRQGSPDVLTLVAEHRPCGDDNVRIAALNGAYEATIGVLKNAGFSEVKGAKPPLEAPVPNEVTFHLSGKTPDGTPRTIVKKLLFRDSIFTFQAAAGSLEDAQALLKVTSTLKQFSSPKPTPQVFEVPALFAISTPSGFFWQEARKLGEGGTQGSVFTCTSEDSTAALVLTLERRLVEEDAQRVASIKGHYNGTIDGLKKGNFTELRASEPTLDVPVPNQVKFLVAGKTPDGAERVFLGLIVFGESLFAFQSIAGTQAEAQQLLTTAASLQEYTAKTPTSNRRSLESAIKQMMAIAERGDAEATLKAVLPPAEFEALMEQEGIEEQLAQFAETKAPGLLAMLKSLDVVQAKFLGNKAAFDLPDRPVLFAKIDGNWRLMN